MVPPLEFLFTLWYPKGSKKNFGQSITLAKVSLAKVSPAKVTLAKVSLRPKCPWPNSLWPRGHSGLEVPPSLLLVAKVPPRMEVLLLWPKCHSGQSVIQPENQIIDPIDIYTTI